MANCFQHDGPECENRKGCDMADVLALLNWFENSFGVTPNPPIHGKIGVLCHVLR